MNGGLSPESIIDDAIEKHIDVIFIHFNNRPSRFLSKITKLNDLAESNQIQVAFINPVPIWPVYVPVAMFEKNELIQTKSDYLIKNKTELDGYSSIKSANFRIISVVDTYCKPQCQYKTGAGKPLYFDNGHLTLTGSKLLNPILDSAIKYYL